MVGKKYLKINVRVNKSKEIKNGRVIKYSGTSYNVEESIKFKDVLSDDVCQAIDYLIHTLECNGFKPIGTTINFRKDLE